MGNLLQTMRMYIQSPSSTPTYEPIDTYRPYINQTPVEEKYSWKKRLLFCLLCCMTTKQ